MIMRSHWSLIQVGTAQSFVVETGNPVAMTSFYDTDRGVHYYYVYIIIMYPLLLCTISQIQSFYSLLVIDVLLIA